jgi:hypothetical protein
MRTGVGWSGGGTAWGGGGWGRLPPWSRPTHDPAVASPPPPLRPGDQNFTMIVPPAPPPRFARISATWRPPQTAACAFYPRHRRLLTASPAVSFRTDLPIDTGYPGSRSSTERRVMHHPWCGEVRRPWTRGSPTPGVDPGSDSSIDSWRSTKRNQCLHHIDFCRPHCSPPSWGSARPHAPAGCPTTIRSRRAA